MSVAARAEGAKYAGLVAMIVDHLWRFLGVPLPGASVIGRLAFPCFAIALGAQVAARAGDAAARRTLCVGVAAAPVCYVVQGGALVDVLCTLGLGAQAFACLRDWPRARGLAGVVVCAIGASFCEYGPAGAALVVASAGLVERPARIEFLGVGLVALAMLAGRGGVGVVLGALVAVALILKGPQFPRVRRLFLLTYIVQWPALMLARALP